MIEEYFLFIEHVIIYGMFGHQDNERGKQRAN